MRDGVRWGGLVLLLFVFFLALPRIAAEGSAEDKLAEIERENAVLRKQNAALREQTRLPSGERRAAEAGTDEAAAASAGRRRADMVPE